MNKRERDRETSIQFWKLTWYSTVQALKTKCSDKKIQNTTTNDKTHPKAPNDGKNDGPGAMSLLFQIDPCKTLRNDDNNEQDNVAKFVLDEGKNGAAPPKL